MLTDNNQHSLFVKLFILEYVFFIKNVHIENKLEHVSDTKVAKEPVWEVS